MASEEISETTKNTTIGKENGSSNKTIPKEEMSEKLVSVKKEAEPTVTGREIIKKFQKGDLVAHATYRKICNALSTLESWPSDAAKIQLLEQFLDLGDILDNHCDLLVQNILNLRWSCVPTSVLPDFRRLLCELGVRQLCFTEIVYQSVVNRFIPEMNMDEETKVETVSLDEEKQKSLYIMAHQILAHIIKCFPMSAKTLLKCVRSQFPHYTQTPKKAAAYMRNLIIMQQYTPTIRTDVWEAIIARLIRDDAHVSKSELGDGSGSPSLFAMDDDVLLDDVDMTRQNTYVDERLEQLDVTITDIMTYITMVHNPAAPAPSFVEDSKWLMLAGDVTSDQLFSTFVGILETQMLMASHVRHVSFIWLYLCSLRTEYAPKILEALWSIVCRLPRAPADSKKSQGAAAYFDAFLARAKYIRIGDGFIWLEEMFQWLLRYVDQCASGGSQTLPGLQRHGTFYAVCQAFFLVFSFRYREFVRNREQMDVIRHWGLGRIVHSPLDPLKFVSRPVALCFSAITRSLQLVYCGHLIPVNDDVDRPFEEMFPLDSYNLKVSSEYVTSLMRRFSPLAEDVSTVSAALSWNAKTNEKLTDKDASNGGNKEMEQFAAEMAFLDEDDFAIGSVRERCGSQSNRITVYSSSPGLRTFETP
ncbi:unnamed protein product [Caenorhabditis auriculariae]|uniref:RNA polymerase I-specific transcription initiation factor RRN3 n=1 Tax=Caenorhabditis auriculariae TaxID=2777116 RepID=A0A8S1HTP6_9PELO|nr:unnamed protein product [Caenorhabditis auriculariae]